MSSVNPYLPPEAEVLASGSGVTQPIRLFSWKGRIGRLRMFTYAAGISIVFDVLYFLLLAAFGFGKATSSGFGLIYVSSFVPLFIVLSMLYAKRLHDLDWSAWWMLLFFVPLANLVIGLLMAFKGGTPGENRFGAPPPPNSLGVKISFGLCILLFVAVIAAIAMPAYQGYLIRAQSGVAGVKTSDR